MVSLFTIHLLNYYIVKTAVFYAQATFFSCMKPFILFKLFLCLYVRAFSVALKNSRIKLFS